MDSDLSRYETVIDLSNPNASHSLLVRLVGDDRRVLDVGCWTGGLGEAMKSRGCRVTGLEIDAEAVAKARGVLDEVVQTDIEATPVSEHFAPGSFDAITFGDVLEHLTDPRQVLLAATELLAPGGRILASIPNVTHGSVRLALLQGRWDYTTTGLLDRTHLRFFSRAGVQELFASAGLVVEELTATMMDPLGGEVEFEPSRLPPGVVEWVRDEPDSLVYQFVVAARRPVDGEDPTTAEAELRPAVPASQARSVDDHTTRARAELEERQRLLTVRDHIIGLEAQAATAQTRAAIAERQLKGAQKRLERKNLRIRQLSREVGGAERPDDSDSESGSSVRSALGRLRRGPSTP